MVVACRTGGPVAGGRGDDAAAVDGDGSCKGADNAVGVDGGVFGGFAAVGCDANDANAANDARADTTAPPPADEFCVPSVESSVCDPVCNTGCPLLLRCDVADQPRTGRCVGIWISGEGELCLKTEQTNPCAPHFTCVEGACRRLCYRDSDCAAPGTCCRQDLLLDSQSSGYKICVACAP